MSVLIREILVLVNQLSLALRDPIVPRSLLAFGVCGYGKHWPNYTGIAQAVLHVKCKNY